MFLSYSKFGAAVENTQLISIDLVAKNQQNHVLLDYYLNRPAKGFMVCTRWANFKK